MSEKKNNVAGTIGAAIGAAVGAIGGSAAANELPFIKENNVIVTKDEDEELVEVNEDEILQAEVVYKGTTTDDSGEEVDVVALQSDEDVMVLVDVDGDHYADIVMADIDGDGEVSEDEMFIVDSTFDLSEVETGDQVQLEDILSSNDDMASINDTDYINDANVDDYTA